MSKSAGACPAQVYRGICTR